MVPWPISSSYPTLQPSIQCSMCLYWRRRWGIGMYSSHCLPCQLNPFSKHKLSWSDECSRETTKQPLKCSSTGLVSRLLKPHGNLLMIWLTDSLNLTLRQCSFEGRAIVARRDWISNLKGGNSNKPLSQTVRFECCNYNQCYSF